MLITTIALALGMGTSPVDDKPMACAMMGGAVNKSVGSVEYAGASYGFCCGGCPEAFAKDPKTAIKKQEKGSAVIGAFLFDPISHNRISAVKAKGTADFQGVRYFFENKDNLKAFTADSKKYATAPKKESLVCPVSGETIASYSKSSGYVDHKEVRYYFCCADCVPAFTKNPEKHAGKSVNDPKSIAVKAS